MCFTKLIVASPISGEMPLLYYSAKVDEFCEYLVSSNTVRYLNINTHIYMEWNAGLPTDGDGKSGVVVVVHCTVDGEEHKGLVAYNNDQGNGFWYVDMDEKKEEPLALDKGKWFWHIEDDEKNKGDVLVDEGKLILCPRQREENLGLVEYKEGDAEADIKGEGFW